VSPIESHPGPWAAVGLTLAAVVSSQLFAAVIAGPEPSPGVLATALGLGLTVGFGGFGTLAARRVPPPAEVRLGLRGFRPAFLVPMLLLVPVAILSSELDNVARALFPPSEVAADAAGAATGRLEAMTSLDLVQNAVLIVGLAPVLEEWFFRGVLQQGVVARLGSVRGVALTSLLFALAHGGPGTSFPIWLAAAAGSLLYGIAFGALRLASGSLLAPILLHTAVNACGVLGVAFAERLPIAGFNAPGAHSPLALVGAALVSCALGFALLRRLAPHTPDAPGAPREPREPHEPHEPHEPGGA